MTCVGVGSSQKRTAALAQLNGAAPMMVLAFANYGYNQATLLEAIREVAGPDAQISGCSSEGVIFQGGCDESPNAVSVMMMASDTIVATAINVPVLLTQYADAVQGKPDDAPKEGLRPSMRLRVSAITGG